MNIENDINYSSDFDYPLEIEAEVYFDVTATDIIIRFSNILFSAPKPKLTLAALLYGSGMDVGIYLGCNNTLTDIASHLGESKQNFSILVKKMRKEFSLDHTNTGKTDSAKDKYKNTNYRKPSNKKYDETDK